MAAVRANARIKLRVLGTLLGRSNDAQHNSAAREEARFRKAEWDNYDTSATAPEAKRNMIPSRIRALHLIDACAQPTWSLHDSDPIKVH